MQSLTFIPSAKRLCIVLGFHIILCFAPVRWDYTVSQNINIADGIWVKNATERKHFGYGNMTTIILQRTEQFHSAQPEDRWYLITHFLY